MKKEFIPLKAKLNSIFYVIVGIQINLVNEKKCLLAHEKKC